MIRFASEADIPAIMKFIDENWRKNHVLSRNRELFEFQHRWGDEITYVLSKKDGLITGILGYIPYGSSNRDALLTTWKAIKTEDTMQGIRLLTYLRENGNVRSVASPGINPKTISIYKFLNFNTGVMKQWYRLQEKPEYRIAWITNCLIPQVDNTEEVYVAKINSFSES